MGSEFIPFQSESFGTISIGRIMDMRFDFIFGGRSNSPYTGQPEMFFRIGYDSALGTSCDAQNSRYPSLWLSADSETLYVSASDGDGCSNIYLLDEFGTITPGLSHYFRIYFNDTSISVSITRDIFTWTKAWPRSPTLESHLGDAVPVWFMSNKFGPSVYNHANGTFSNVVITSRLFTYDTYTPSDVPTSLPTVIPSDIPTEHPISPTAKPTANGAKPTFSPTLKPTISPTIDILVNNSSIYSQNTSSLSSIPGIYFLIAGATAISLCFICLGLLAFLWVRCKSMHSQIHDIRGHIRKMSGKELQSASDFESFYSPVNIHNGHANGVNGQNGQHIQNVHVHQSQIVPGHLGYVEDVNHINHVGHHMSHVSHTPHNTATLPITIPLHSPVWISNVLSVVISIADYDDDDGGDISLDGIVTSPLNDSHHSNGIEKDWMSTHALFEYLNYDVIPGESMKSLRWTEDKLVRFLQNGVGSALFGGTDQLQYDGLVVVISCRGLKNAVITSDLKLIEKDALHRLVSLFHPKVREIPRLFVIDCCPAKLPWSQPRGGQGQGTRPPLTVLSLSMKQGDSATHCTLSRRETVRRAGNKVKLKALDTETVRQWTSNCQDPDYNLAVVYAENEGGSIGSYFMGLFADKVKENLERKQGYRMADICHQIQEVMHNEGSHVKLPKPVFYGDTRNMMLRVNKAGVNNRVGR